MSSFFFFKFKEKLGENEVLHRLFEMGENFIFSCEFLKLLSDKKPS